MEFRKLHRSRAFFILGLAAFFLGILSTAGTAATAASLMRLRENRVSIVLLFALHFLTLSTAAHAVMIQKRNLLLALVVGRYFAAGFGVRVLLTAFGSATWLIQPMYQFTEWWGLILLSVFTARWCDGPCRRRDRCLCMILAAAVAVFDFCAVSPFLAAVLNGR